MRCKKCNKKIPDESVFCMFCGVRLVPLPRAPKKRGNGQGTVFPRNGRWVAQITLGYDKNGKRKTLSKVFDKKTDAINALPNMRKDAIAKTVDASATFAEVYELMITEHSRRISESTADLYGYAFKHFASIDFLPIAEIRTEHLQKCVDECGAGKRTQENMKAVASLTFKYAMRNDIVAQNYAEYIVTEKTQSEEREVFTAEEISTILSATPTNRFAGYVATLIFTGMRPGEMFALTKEDYHGSYFVGGSKTTAGKNRIIPIPNILTDFVRNQFKSASTFMFPSEAGERMDLSNFRNRHYYPLLESLGVRKLPPYSCRHTFATLLKGVNIPVTDKQKLMGHSSFSMTAHYTHADLDSLESASNTIVSNLMQEVSTADALQTDSEKSQ